MMTNTDTDLQLRRKKLLWRANHRGMKEMDLMLGQYGQQNLTTMGTRQLDEFEAILEVCDVQLKEWLTEQSAIPTQLQTSTFARIKSRFFIASDYKNF